MYSYISKINKLHKTKTKAAFTIGHKDKSSKNSVITSFEEFEKFTSVNLSSSVNFQAGSFVNCINLKSIKLPPSVTTTGISTFEGCVNLSSVVFNKNITTVGTAAFLKCPLEGEISLKRITSVGGGAFYGAKLSKVEFEDLKLLYQMVCKRQG